MGQKSVKVKLLQANVKRAAVCERSTLCIIKCILYGAKRQYLTLYKICIGTFPCPRPHFNRQHRFKIYKFMRTHLPIFDVKNKIKNKKGKPISRVKKTTPLSPFFWLFLENHLIIIVRVDTNCEIIVNYHKAIILLKVQTWVKFRK